MVERKYIDYKSFKFPEINPIELKSKTKNQEVKLANYRYPAKSQESKKGIIYFIPGYGDYVGRYGYLGK